MGKSERLNAKGAESLLLKAGFVLSRSKGSHRIYISGSVRIVVPFHSNGILHPGIIRQVFEAIERAGEKKGVQVIPVSEESSS